jgi:hypothetical protein
MQDNSLSHFLYKPLQIGTLVYFNFQTENDACTVINIVFNKDNQQGSIKHSDKFSATKNCTDRLCGLAVRVLGYRSGGSVTLTTWHTLSAKVGNYLAVAWSV